MESRYLEENERLDTCEWLVEREWLIKGESDRTCWERKKSESEGRNEECSKWSCKSEKCPQRARKKRRASDVVNGCKLIAVMWILIPINQGQCSLRCHPCMAGKKTGGSLDLIDTHSHTHIHVYTNTKIYTHTAIHFYEACKSPTFWIRVFFKRFFAFLSLWTADSIHDIKKEREEFDMKQRSTTGIEQGTLHPHDMRFNRSASRVFCEKCDNPSAVLGGSLIECTYRHVVDIYKITAKHIS